MLIVSSESPYVLPERRSHADRVADVLDREAEDPLNERIIESWRRSASEHGLDPTVDTPPDCITDRELREAREPLGALLAIAEGELGKLNSIVRQVGYALVVSNADSIELEIRGNDADLQMWRGVGGRPGADWSERRVGTNGIGTCVAERRSLVVHRNQHFSARYMGASCTAAPLFDPDGALLGVLDISSIDPRLSERSHALTLPILESTVNALEERLFRERFSQAWVLAVMASPDAPLLSLLAVDHEQRVIGADRHMRATLGLSADVIRDGLALRDLFAHERAAFRQQDGADSLIQLEHVQDGSTLAAMVSAPSGRSTFSLTALQAVQRTRSRRGLMADAQHGVGQRAAAPTRGGLSAGVLHRVHRHVEQHLHESISLDALAREANLSVHHFARAFKQAVGLPPHRYLLARRVERAKGHLLESDRTVAEIALLVGFSDQSHFARHFGRSVGCTPGAFRRARR